jgi:anti-sigma factor (TIGR02949 family)
MKSFPKDKHTTNCLEGDKCLESLQLILDGEASRSDEETFMNHLEICMPCYNYYNMDKAVKELIQTKIVKVKMPEDLVKKLKFQLENIKE